MFERILYAVERSTGDVPSYRLVRELALFHQSEVVLLRVGEIREDQLALARKHEIDVEGLNEEAVVQARIDGRLETFDVARALTQAGVSVRTLSRAGRVVEELLRAADEVDADLLVVGSAPHTALGAMLTGNVTDEIVRKARRPVLVVPRDERDRNGETATPGS
jgi:nucleotide-binding universal stress UspA family protein